MTVDIESERERLSHAEFLKRISQDFKPTDLITVWRRHQTTDARVSVFSAFLASAKVEDALRRASWDLTIGGGMPGACKYSGPEGEPNVEYLRYGNNDGVEPLVIWRDFAGMRDAYFEISEEFRLFHDLYHDRATDKYIKIDDAGNETDVIVVETDGIRIRLKEIRQFLAVREMHLALYFDIREYSAATLADLGKESGGDDIRNGLMTHCVAYGESSWASELKTFSRLLGKRLFEPFSKEKSGFWGFAKEEPEPEVDFIIGVDDNGDDVLNTSDEARLSNNFGANPGEPHYLTPVFFRRTVLERYYQAPKKFSVEDGYLRCGGLWGVTMDNHHDQYVVAWLGDLGRDLPYEHRLHWKSHNIAPCGGVSKVFFKRQILAQATNSDQPDVEFQHRFPEFCAYCVGRLGWSPFLPLAEGDQHYLSTLRIPATDEQKEFDDLILGLTKVLVDSLNEKELLKRIPVAEREGTKGSISRLERALASLGAEGYGEHIQFLRDLQDLRSTGSVHRKGSKYQKVAKRLKMEEEQLATVFRTMLVDALSFVEYLQAVVDDGLLDAAIQKSSERPEGNASPAASGGAKDCGKHS